MTAKLAWDDFKEAYYPQRRRHDLEALTAYELHRTDHTPAGPDPRLAAPGEGARINGPVDTRASVPAETMVRFGKLELPARKVAAMRGDELVALLVRSGLSRVTAGRILELRGSADPGRARSRPTARASTVRR